MTRYWPLIVMVAAGCVPPTFHAGRTSLASYERGVLEPRQATPKRAFARSWRSPTMGEVGLLRWEGERSSACAAGPKDLLQAMRDDLGRLNQGAGIGEDLSVAVTIYRFERAGIWREPTAFVELVARDPVGRVVWAAEDGIEAKPELAQTLADTPSTIIAREVRRRTGQEIFAARK